MSTYSPIKYLILLLVLLSLFCVVSCENEQESPQLPQGNVIVSFETNCDVTVPIKKVPIGSTFSAPIAPQKNGYVFDGWYLGDKEYSFENVVTKEMTLVAHWKPIQYKITYIRGEGTIHSYTVDDEFELPNVHEEYYEFCGWSETYNGAKIITKIEKGTTGNITLYAIKKLQPFKFKEKSDGTYEIIGVDLGQYDDEQRKDIVLPKTYKGKIVTSIGNNAFEYSAIEKITIPGNIKEIGDYAFYKSTLETVVFDYGVKVIGKNAFENCSNLENVAWGSSIEVIDDCAFHNCTKITGIYLPLSLKEIGTKSFANCKSLTRVFIYDNVSIIREYAFLNCNATICAQAKSKPNGWKINANYYGVRF